MLDDLQGFVDAGGSGEGFHEGIASFLALEYFYGFDYDFPVINLMPLFFLSKTCCPNVEMEAG